MIVNKKIWLSLAGICIVSGLVFGAFKAGSIASDAKGVNLQLSKTDSPPVTPLVDTMEQEREQSRKNAMIAWTTVKTDTTESSEQQGQAIDGNKNEGIIKDLITKEGFIEAKENELYAQKKGIIVDKKIIVAVEGYRIIVDESSFSTDKYYAVIDFTVMNLDSTNYFSSLSRFTLRDSNLYTYTPTRGANTRGDVSGNLKFRDSRRGEIAFYVPEKETKLELHFNTGIDAVKTVRFSIDTDSLVNPPRPTTNPHEQY